MNGSLSPRVGCLPALPQTPDSAEPAEAPSPTPPAPASAGAGCLDLAEESNPGASDSKQTSAAPTPGDGLAFDSNDFSSQEIWIPPAMPWQATTMQTPAMTWANSTWIWRTRHLVMLSTAWISLAVTLGL